MSHSLLAIELVAVFAGLPLLFRFALIRLPALTALWAVTGYALWQLIRDPSFHRFWLWNDGAITPRLPSILLIFAPAAFVMWITIRLRAPELQWALVRQKTLLWAIVMVAYPVFSVYPQGLLYRAFFFHRYAALFPNRWAMIVASAAAFAFVHIIFHNRLAVLLTFAGGLLFAWRFSVTHSLAATSLEHSLYGCWLFTVGLGHFFYHGTIKDVRSIVQR